MAIAADPRGHDEAMTDKWSCQHFSLANPLHRGATDLPKLLRRVATEIETRHIGPMDLLDLTIHQEMTGAAHGGMRRFTGHLTVRRMRVSAKTRVTTAVSPRPARCQPRLAGCARARRPRGT